MCAGPPIGNHVQADRTLPRPRRPARTVLRAPINRENWGYEGCQGRVSAYC